MRQQEEEEEEEEGEKMDYKLLTVEQWNAHWEKECETKVTGGSEDENIPSAVSGDIHEEGDGCSDIFGGVNPMVVKHKEVVFPKEVNDGKGRVFLPLCGNSKELRWFAEQGKTVIGIECSSHCIVSFFLKNKIEYVETKHSTDENFVVFKSVDKKLDITLYCGDYFCGLNSSLIGGKVDVIWDSASLNTISLPLRTPYIKVMKELMHSKTRYLLSAMFFGPLKTWANNPYDISVDDMSLLFNHDFWSTEVIDEDSTEWGTEQIFLIGVKG